MRPRPPLWRREILSGEEGRSRAGAEDRQRQEAEPLSIDTLQSAAPGTCPGDPTETTDVCDPPLHERSALCGPIDAAIPPTPSVRTPPLPHTHRHRTEYRPLRGRMSATSVDQ